MLCMLLCGNRTLTFHHPTPSSSLRQLMALALSNGGGGIDIDYGFMCRYGLRRPATARAENREAFASDWYSL